MEDKYFITALNELIEETFSKKEKVEVLEAGCGSITRLNVPSNFNVTGIDISQKQLDRNRYLNNKICADIQEYNFEPETFDVIISWCVLEHIRKPEKVLEQFSKALKPGGLLIIALPNIWSVKGMAAKLTPTWFHIWYYRHILKDENAGKDDNGPFKTYLKTSISPVGIAEFVQDKELVPVFFEYFTFSHYNEAKSKLPVYLAQELFSILLYLFSFGNIKKKNSEFVIAIRKP